MKIIIAITVAFLILQSPFVNCTEANQSVGSSNQSELSKKEIELIKKIESNSGSNISDASSYIKTLSSFSLLTETAFIAKEENISRQIGLQSAYLLKISYIWCKNKNLQNKITYDATMNQLNLLIDQMNKLKKPVIDQISVSAPLPPGVYGASGTDYHTETNLDKRILWETAVEKNNANINQLMINNNIESKLPMLKKRVEWIEHIIASSGK